MPICYASARQKAMRGQVGGRGPTNSLVMPGLVPGIHIFILKSEGVDGRDKPGHDEKINLQRYAFTTPIS
jgi:hypothetical protein